MESAYESRRPSAASALLAGLQAGMLGVCWMLAWLGVSAAWQRRSFWTAENLMASAFYGDRAIRSGFAGRTLSGLALYLLLYSVLGAVFAYVFSNRLPRIRVLLVAVIFALVWYYISFRLMWRSVMPLVALLHSEQPTVLGHLVYGTFLGRYPGYLPKPAAGPVAPPEAPVAAPEPQAPELPAPPNP